MMNFQFKHPFVLALGALVIAAVIARDFFAGKLKSRILFSLPVKITADGGLFPALARTIPDVLRVLALMLMVAALARPQKINRQIAAPVSGVDIILCIDTSPSMRAMDFDPYDRITAAKNTALDFIAKRQTDRIGAVVFGGTAFMVCPLTLDYQALSDFVGQIYAGMTHTNNTAIGDAIAVAVNHIKDSNAKSKVIILLTDGRSNAGDITDPEISAKAAASFGIKIYTIGTAEKGPAKVPVYDDVFGKRFVMIEDDLDETTLQKIASATGGEFFRATNYEELSQIYQRINELEKTKFNAPETLDYTDLYVPLLALAVILLLAEFLAKRVIFLKIP